jgi:Family of unknown function (DUF6680)
MSVGTLLIVASAVLGPLAAVLLLLRGLDRDRTHQRRLNLLLSMLSHRRLWLSTEWAGGLNLVLIEFADHPEVIDALNKLIDGYSNPGWLGAEAQRQRLILDTETACCTLLVRMAAALKYDLKMSDLRSRAFTPHGWSADDVQARHSRDLLQMVLQGARPLRIEIGQLGKPPPESPMPLAVRESSEATAP